MSNSITEPFFRVRMLLRKLHHLKQMELLKSAPSGAFLVCLNPIKHNKHSELVDTILTNLGVYCFNSFCCATLFASTSLICSLVKPE